MASPGLQVASGVQVPVPSLKMVPVVHASAMMVHEPLAKTVLSPQTVSVSAQRPVAASSWVPAPQAAVATSQMPSPLSVVPAAQAPAAGTHSPASFAAVPAPHSWAASHSLVVVLNVVPLAQSVSAGTQTPPWRTVLVPHPVVSSTQVPSDRVVPSAHVTASASGTHSPESFSVVPLPQVGPPQPVIVTGIIVSASSAAASILFVSYTLRFLTSVRVHAPGPPQRSAPGAS